VKILISKTKYLATHKHNKLLAMASFHTKTFTKHDDYMTPKYAWENINEYIPKDKVIWESFYGDGKSAGYLRELGCT